MFPITFPSNTEDIIDAIRGAIGRNVTFVEITERTPCPVCGIDPVTNTAIDPFCTTCSGYGYLYTYSGTTISGHVTWGHSELLNWQTGGQLDDGECRVQVKYTVANADLVENASWVEIDGRKMQKVKIILRGVPAINRILVDLIEQEKE